MLIIRHTIETDIDRAQIWPVWEDVERWNTWDAGTEFSQIDGPFQTGTTGILKPVKGPLLKTRLIHVEPYKSFVQEAELFLAKAVMTHSMVPVGAKTRVTFQTEIRGPLALFYFLLIGSSIKKKIPIEMEEMLKMVR